MPSNYRNYILKNVIYIFKFYFYFYKFYFGVKNCPYPQRQFNNLIFIYFLKIKIEHFLNYTCKILLLCFYLKNLAEKKNKEKKKKTLITDKRYV